MKGMYLILILVVVGVLGYLILKPKDKLVAGAVEKSEKSAFDVALASALQNLRIRF